MYIPECPVQLVTAVARPLPGSMCACPLSPSLGKMAVNWKMAAFQRDTSQNLAAAGRAVQLEITPVRASSSRFNVLALSWRPCRGGLSVSAVTEVSGPWAPRCSHSHGSAWGSSACFRASSIRELNDILRPHPRPADSEALQTAPSSPVSRAHWGVGTHTAASVTIVKGKPSTRSPR